MPVDFHDRRPGGACRFAEQAAVAVEVEAEPFRDREDKLPLGHRGADGVGEALGSADLRLQTPKDSPRISQSARRPCFAPQ